MIISHWDGPWPDNSVTSDIFYSAQKRCCLELHEIYVSRTVWSTFQQCTVSSGAASLTSLMCQTDDWTNWMMTDNCVSKWFTTISKHFFTSRCTLCAARTLLFFLLCSFNQPWFCLAEQPARRPPICSDSVADMMRRLLSLRRYFGSACRRCCLLRCSARLAR